MWVKGKQALILWVNHLEISKQNPPNLKTSKHSTCIKKWAGQSFPTWNSDHLFKHNINEEDNQQGTKIQQCPVIAPKKKKKKAKPQDSTTLISLNKLL